MKFRVVTPNQTLVVKAAHAPEAAEKVVHDKVWRLAGVDTLGGVFTNGTTSCSVHRVPDNTPVSDL